MQIRESTYAKSFEKGENLPISMRSSVQCFLRFRITRVVAEWIGKKRRMLRAFVKLRYPFRKQRHRLGSCGSPFARIANFQAVEAVAQIRASPVKCRDSIHLNTKC